MPAKRSAHRLAGLALLAGLAIGPDDALAQSSPDFTVEPVTQPFVLPETEIGVLHFTITDNLPIALTVAGYAPIIQFLFGDFTDDFDHQILGPATPYVLLPDVPQDVPVLIIPDLEMDDDPLDAGYWSFDLGPQVFVAPHVPAFGDTVAAEVIIYDVDEPETAALLLGGLLALALARPARFRRRRGIAGAAS